jgi:hypothetical protein
MRRKTRKALIHFSLFLCALFLILYLNRPQSKGKAFSWTTICYKTTSPTLPAALGICHGLESSSKPALVVARVSSDGDTTWLDSLAKKYHLCIYTADANTHLQVPANRGHEAMAYLTFLIDNYHHIPISGAVFIHGSRYAWHNDHPSYDNLALLSQLNISSALEQHGYHNLKCDWSLSTCLKSYPPQGGLETSMQAVTSPWDAKAVSDAALPAALSTLFGSTAGIGRTETVRSQCCAQFVVSRSSIWAHSRDEYVALRQWLLDDGSAPKDDKVAGRILSYLWHVLFLAAEGGEGGVELETLNKRACPRAEVCYCRLYGRCELEGCERPGSCTGQYQLPKDLKLPGDWGDRQL